MKKKGKEAVLLLASNTDEVSGDSFGNARGQFKELYPGYRDLPPEQLEQTFGILLNQTKSRIGNVETLKPD